jgi:hypothetical protein
MMARSDDLDAIVSELNADAPRARAAGDDAQLARLLSWLDQMVARSASDLLLVAGAPPSLRVDGAIAALDAAVGGPLGSEEIEDAVLPALPPHARRVYREAGIADSAGALPPPSAGCRPPSRALPRSGCRRRSRR